MFGYITINKPELKIKEFDEYMNSQVELYIDDLDRLYNPFE